MPVNWMDVSQLSFNALLLLERVQLSWFPGWVPEAELAIALKANPAVEWYLRHKCPELNEWVNKAMGNTSQALDANEIRRAEVTVLRAINDLVVYVLDPAVYDAQSFLNWDSGELDALVDFSGATVIDVGAGTGRLALVAAQKARVVFAVEPVANLRLYLKGKARSQDLCNIYPVDGLITDIPFPDHFADITLGGHVFGDLMEKEYREVLRVTRPGGMIIFCPGNDDVDNERHRFLISAGFEWSRFYEPGNAMVRKYWKTV